MRRVLFAVAMGLAVASPTANGQYSAFNPSGPSVYHEPQSYSSYYTQQLKQDYRPQASVRNYTIDRYFYHRPTLSPYLNLTRRGGAANLNNYYRYVRPEVDRREAAGKSQMMAQASRMNQPIVPTTPPANPGHLPVTNPYFNQYYNTGHTIKSRLPPPPTPLPKLIP